jgi:hypothetical protein
VLQEQAERDAGPPDHVVVGAAAGLGHRLGQPLLRRARPASFSARPQLRST